MPEDPGRYLGGLNVLGQPLWTPPGPNGFADSNAAWAAPEGMKLRLDIAAQIAARLGDSIDPRELLDVAGRRGGVAARRGRPIARAEIAAAGAGAAVDVAGIPEEMSDGLSVESRMPRPSRRALLLGGASFAAWAYLPKFARAADGRDPRLVVIILRGALDGLATVAPLGDPDYAGLHGSIALTRDGPNAALPLDSFFALHPAMPEFARLYRDKQAAVVHAVATAYRERSHFDGQDVLESGYAGSGPRAVRLAQPRAGGAAARRARASSALAVGADHAAGAARRGADGRLGAGRPAAGRRRHRDARCSISTAPRSRAWRAR